MKNPGLKALVLMVIVGLFAGCADSKKENRGGVRANRGGAVTPAGGTSGPNPGEPFKMAYGNFSAFTTDAVTKLVSASMNPETDMRLPIAGISLQGDMRLSGSTQNILALGSGTAQIVSGSEFALYIVDDYTKTDGLEAITIGFKPGGKNGYNVSGTVSNNGTVQMTFTDNYGDIYVNGTTNSNTKKFTGTVKFKNSKGTYSGQTFELGTFSVDLCGFFHCL